MAPDCSQFWISAGGGECENHVRELRTFFTLSQNGYGNSLAV